MKKKGLIISTAVMVVVLIAALTTSTFAWFTTDAQASLTDFTLTTTATTGLEIAAYYYTDKDTPGWNSGTVSKLAIDGDADTNGSYWGGGTAGFGSELQIEASTLPGLYGTSGDGLNLFTNSDADQKLTAGHPAQFKKALPNDNFYQIDFALRSAQQGDLFIKQFDVTPAGDDAKTGMAGALRIALFITKTAPEKGHASFTVASDGALLYDPYAYQHYSNGSWVAGNDESTILFANKAGDDYENSRSTTALSNVANWGTKYKAGTVQSGASATTAPVASKPTLTDKAASDALFGELTAGKGMNAGDILYVRIVIWFEGEDSACIQPFAGGGATVAINFGIEKEGD